MTRKLSYKELMMLLSEANASLEIKKPGVTCMPIGLCSCVYGTVTEHFTHYGFVSPSEFNCLTQDGLVLCIAAANPCVDEPETTTEHVHVHPIQTEEPVHVQPVQTEEPVHVHPVQTTAEPVTWTPWTTAAPTEPATTPKPYSSNGVNIIGPSPTYNNYAVIQGPQVHYTKDKYGRTVFKKIVPGKAHWSQWKPSQNYYHSVNNNIEK